MSRAIAAVLAGSMALVGCADAPVAQSASDELVEFAARWQCDRQRFAVDSLADFDRLLDERLRAAGIADDEYLRFEADLGSDGDLRSRVSAAYRQACGE